VRDIDVITERLIATALEATIIVVESRLHGDPVPALRDHYSCIVEERARLYAHYHHIDRSTVDTLLREQGMRALRDEYRADTRQGQDSLRRTFLDVLFCDGGRCPSTSATHLIPWLPSPRNAAPRLAGLL
jgi:hypothetical protein